MGRFRWIDARKGILEYTRAAIDGICVLDFTEMTVRGMFARDMYLPTWSRAKATLKLVFHDGEFCAQNKEVPEAFIHHEDQSKMLEHYQSWLSRVMLAEDIHKSRSDERQDESPADQVLSSREEALLESSRHRSDNSRDHSDKRDSLRKNNRDIPVVRGELAWRLRPK